MSQRRHVPAVIDHDSEWDILEQAFAGIPLATRSMQQELSSFDFDITTRAGLKLIVEVKDRDRDAGYLLQNGPLIDLAKVKRCQKLADKRGATAVFIFRSKDGWLLGCDAESILGNAAVIEDFQRKKGWRKRDKKKPVFIIPSTSIYIRPSDEALQRNPELAWHVEEWTFWLSPEYLPGE